MVRITEDLIRKKAEHNEGIIGTLEELSLHQEDVEKIEHINNWCKDIQILYLQANLISKIENLNKLKKLEYLNLAINNIERIENLERCEFLEKLDLTLNFIGDLKSVCSLQKNLHLKHLYLTGNPCCDYEGYRQYVIVSLPQIRTLDGTEITKSERIKAKQNFKEIENGICAAEAKYFAFRKEQRERASNVDSSMSDEEFWKSTSEHSPETRTEISRRSRKAKEVEQKPKETKTVAVFSKSGRPLNINQAKLNFKFIDDDPEKLTLDLAVYKYLDTNLIEIDLQPIYVRITIKGKIFQIVFPEEILIDSSVAQRSQTTGHLLLEMPKANYKPLKHKKKNIEPEIKKAFVEPQTPDVKIESLGKDLMENSEVPPLEYG